jgi:DNA repair exonuclease SbcCD nuclease subunit
LKILRVGDPHAKVGCLEEMKQLILFIVEQAKLHSVDRIEVLGDLFHTHNVIRLEVIEFWVWALDLLSNTCETVVLVGNHDQSGDYNSDFSALTVFSLMQKPNLKIIEKPTQLGVFGYVPYTHDSASFINAARTLQSNGCTVLICHQTIEGSQYESGIYAPDGIPSAEWADSFLHVISGHIHSEQAFGNIIYPGTARWDSVTDANRRKGIWRYIHDPVTGAIQSADFISTEKVCSPIRSIEWREGNPEPDKWEPNERVTVELIGSSVWIAGVKDSLKGKCAIKSKITDSAKKVTRKTGNNFEQFIKELFTSNFDKQNLLKYAKEIGIV